MKLTDSVVCMLEFEISPLRMRYIKFEVGFRGVGVHGSPTCTGKTGLNAVLQCSLDFFNALIIVLIIDLMDLLNG